MKHREEASLKKIGPLCVHNTSVEHLTYQVYKRDEISHHKCAQRNAPDQERFILEDGKVEHRRSPIVSFFCFIHLFLSLTGHSIEQGTDGT